MEILICGDCAAANRIKVTSHILDLFDDLMAKFSTGSLLSSWIPEAL